MNRPDRLLWISIIIPLVVTGAHFAVMIGFRFERPHWYLSEFGPHEMGSGLLFLAACVLGVMTLRQHGPHLPRKGWWLIALFTLAAGFVGLEELSYGQHLVGWESPAFFEETNVQRETNLHNLGSQGPQRVMSTAGEVGIILLGLVLPFVFHRFSDDAYQPGHWPRYLVPDGELATVALLTIVMRLVKDADPVVLEHKATDEFVEFLWACGAVFLMLILRRRAQAETSAPRG